MKIKWKKFLLDTLLTVTFPFWILPVGVFLIVAEGVKGFIDNYTE